MSGVSWDVHAHTPTIREAIRSGLLYKCVAETIGAQHMQPPKDERVNTALGFSRTTAALKADEFGLSLPSIKACLQKFKTRWESGSWKDPHLENIDIATLFVVAVGMVQYHDFEPSVEKLFLETLQDIGNTCIQGDSHRLIHFIIGVSEKNEGLNK